MKSLDTNILIYAANNRAPEHAKALELVNEMLANPDEWIIADQVLWEFYKALRHSKILENRDQPLKRQPRCDSSVSKVVWPAVLTRPHASPM